MNDWPPPLCIPSFRDSLELPPMPTGLLIPVRTVVLNWGSFASEKTFGRHNGCVFLLPASSG